MARTPSNMLALGSSAPDFKLLDTVSNTTLTLDGLKSDVGTVFMFICNHCPFVIHVQEELTLVAKEYQKKGIAFIAISSNDVQNYPQDRPELMKQMAIQNGFTFPYLYDETQEVAKAYEAACTPDFYLFDSELKLYYRGQLDASRPGNDIPVTGKDLRSALDNLILGNTSPKVQLPSLGCGIKWK